MRNRGKQGGAEEMLSLAESRAGGQCPTLSNKLPLSFRGGLEELLLLPPKAMFCT